MHHGSARRRSAVAYVRLGGGDASAGKGGRPGARKSTRRRKRDAEAERSERPHARLPGGRGKLRGSAMAGREIAGGEG